VRLPLLAAASVPRLSGPPSFQCRALGLRPGALVLGPYEGEKPVILRHLPACVPELIRWTTRSPSDQLLDFFVIVRKRRPGPFYHTIDPLVSSPLRRIGPVVGDEIRLIRNWESARYGDGSRSARSTRVPRPYFFLELHHRPSNSPMTPQLNPVVEKTARAGTVLISNSSGLPGPVKVPYGLICYKMDKEESASVWIVHSAV
jgi:hypothetical protein